MGGIKSRGAMARRSSSRLGKTLAILAAALLTLVGLYAGLTARLDVPPRALAPYVLHRVSDHPRLVGAGEWMARVLHHLDRGEYRSAGRLNLRIGAQREARPVPTSAHIVAVGTAEQVAEAIGRARPGDVITLAPGTYRFAGPVIEVTQPGTPDMPIVLRADRLGDVILEFRVAEGFVVSAPHWAFENLTMRGRCIEDSDCEHAFHVVGAAAHFTARNNLLLDFNAHIKANGDGRRFPDHGVIEGNTLSNTRVRQTDRPVSLIDLVAVDHWIVRGNLISDFAKEQGDRISYGAFAKGGGTGNRFERNVVLCEYLLRGTPGWRVGLSLGGGGSAKGYCRDGACITEQDGGVIEANLIASCSDDGVYINRGATSRIVHNTLIDTGGIVVRFAESSAEVQGNLVDGAIRSRDGGLVHVADNLETGMAGLYFGWHPHRALYRDAPAFDFAWTKASPRLAARPSSLASDLCGTRRPAQPTYGAFEDFSACLGSDAATISAP